MRVAKVITRQGYEGRGALSGLTRSKSGHDCVTGPLIYFEYTGNTV
jgi:hypothetical protein